jgi:predicted NUDIX family NTP pyrophosphohydrolase
MKKRSAGILMYKKSGPELRLLLVHPGGPFWAKKDLGAWSIPKGEYAEGEEPLTAAKREFGEELGAEPSGEFWDLGALVQPGRKEVVAWAVEADFPVAKLTSNTFELEWPPKSGRKRQFPEVDRAEWFTPADARRKILPGQVEFIGRLLARIGYVEQPQHQPANATHSRRTTGQH